MQAGAQSTEPHQPGLDGLWASVCQPVSDPKFRFLRPDSPWPEQTPNWATQALGDTTHLFAYQYLQTRNTHAGKNKLWEQELNRKRPTVMEEFRALCPQIEDRKQGTQGPLPAAASGHLHEMPTFLWEGHTVDVSGVLPLITDSSSGFAKN